jgi:hypothetical protein
MSKFLLLLVLYQSERGLEEGFDVDVAGFLLILSKLTGTSEHLRCLWESN